MTGLWLPSRTADLIKIFGEVPDWHPGLLLDKLSPPGNPDCPELGMDGKLLKNMEIQKKRLEAVTKCTGGEPAAAILAAALARHRQSLVHLGAVTFTATTAAPLTLHLSRANAMENAGLCLHPVRGFAYLPGSGIKGMVRAWAQTVWAPAQSDRQGAEQDIRAVFGWAAGTSEKDSAAGAVIFHDALPDHWPALQVEITNNHHAGYYRGTESPGDWENPVPVYFLAIAPETITSLAVV